MEIPLIHILGVLMLIAVRITGLMLFAPFFGSMVIPARIKAVLVLSLTVLLYPLLKTQLPEVTLVEWPQIAFRELLVGLAVGIATTLVFDAVQMAGQVLSVQMGYSLVNILDPNTQIQSTVMATFHQTIAMLIFLRLDVHLWLLRALGNSFTFLPPGTLHLNALFTRSILGAGASVIELGVQIAAPVLSATLLADIVLALMGKASPQLPLVLLGPAIKSVLGLSILAAALKYWPDMFEAMFLRSMQFSDQLLRAAR